MIVSIALVACGSSGGSGGNSDDGNTPEISDMFLFKFGDPNTAPIMTAEVGDYLMMLFCFCDEDINTNLARISIFSPPDSAQPVDVIEGEFEQSRECGCWYWGPLVPNTAGVYMIRLELRDSEGNWSLPFDLEPFVIMDTNTNFNHLTEPHPEMKLWEE